MLSGIETNQVSPLTSTSLSYRDVLATRLLVYLHRCISHFHRSSLTCVLRSIGDHLAHETTYPLRRSRSINGVTCIFSQRTRGKAVILLDINSCLDMIGSARNGKKKMRHNIVSYCSLVSFILVTPFFASSSNECDIWVCVTIILNEDIREVDTNFQTYGMM